MNEPFSLSSARCAADDADLRAEIHDRTGSSEATSGILRSIDRFGGDSSILRYDISPRATGRGHRNAAPVAWTVRAVRS